jgi:hypothetical protein
MGRFALPSAIREDMRSPLGLQIDDRGKPDRKLDAFYRQKERVKNAMSFIVI